MTRFVNVLVWIVLVSTEAALAQTRQTDRDVILLKHGEKAYALVFPTAASGAPTAEELKLESTGTHSSDVLIQRFASNGSLTESIVKNVTSTTATTVRFDNPNGYLRITNTH